MLGSLLSLVSKAKGAFVGAPPLKVIIWIAALGTCFIAGGLVNGYRWGEKYNAREIEIRDWQLAEKDRLEKEWQVVQDLQETYTELNKETYNDLYQKLDDLATSVSNYGSRTVRVCAARPAVQEPSLRVAPEPAAGTDGAPPDRVPEGVERDSRPSRDPSGYDIFPEVNALMVAAETSAIRCNELIEWERKVQAEVGARR